MYIMSLMAVYSTKSRKLSSWVYRSLMKHKNNKILTLCDNLFIYLDLTLIPDKKELCLVLRLKSRDYERKNQRWWTVRSSFFDVIKILYRKMCRTYLSKLLLIEQSRLLKKTFLNFIPTRDWKWTSWILFHN